MSAASRLLSTLCGVCLVLLPEITSAQGNFYLMANGGVALGFISNYGIGITTPNHEGETMAGFGYQTELGIGYSFKKHVLNVELAIGTYDMSNPTDPGAVLGLKLGVKAFTFRHKYFSFPLRVSYNIPVAIKRVSVELVGGTTFLFNRPTTYFNDEWQYPGFSQWEYAEDLIMARYKTQESLNRQWAFLFNAGFRVLFPVTQRLQLQGHLYYERSFVPIRSVLYSSERIYGHNPDLKYQVLSVFSGDAFGLKIGARYYLKK